MSHRVTQLFVPGDRPERFAKAAASGADIVIIDLEDAVLPAQKVPARAELRPELLRGMPQCWVRINAIATPWHAEDLAAIALLDIAGVMLPKAEDAKAVSQVVKALQGKAVIALIESAKGLANAREIAATSGVAQLAFGSIDYCADLGMHHGREMLLFARAEIVLASRLAGLPAPLDGVCTEINLSEEVEDDARYASRLGFSGKLCIHPKQIAPVRAGFSPSSAEIEWAVQVLAAEGGAATVNGKMVDEPVRIQARHILARKPI